VLVTLRAKAEFDIGDAVNILLRPEDLKIARISEAPVDSGALPGRIDESVYKGATVDLVITLDNGCRLMAAEFFNEDDEEINYNPGERVAVSWVAGWEVVLANEG